MDLSFEPEHLRFREEVREFLRDRACRRTSARRRPSTATSATTRSWSGTRSSTAKGWVAPHWPVEHGGPGLDVTQPLHPHRGARALGRAHALALRPRRWSARSSSSTAPTRRRSASCRRSSPARRCGARATPSPTPAATSPRSRPAPRTTARATSSSTGRRPGPRTPSTPTGSSCWCAPIPAAKKQSGISFLLCDMKTPGVTVKPFLTTGGTPAFSRDVLRQRGRPQGEPGRARSTAAGPWPRRCSATSARSSPRSGQSARAIRRVKRIAAATHRGRAAAARRSRLPRARSRAWRSSCAACRWRTTAPSPARSSATRRGRSRRSSRSAARRSSSRAWSSRWR